MSTILTISPDVAHDLLVAAATAAVTFATTWYYHRFQRHAIAEDKALIRSVAGGQQAWHEAHRERFARAYASLPSAEHEGEVLHVEHATGELPTIAEGLARLADEVGLVQALDDETEHRPTCPDLFYCPTVDEVESGCHGGFDVCCYAPELHRPMTEAELDDPAWNKLISPADDTDRPGLHLVLLAIPVALWDRLRDAWQDWRQARRDRDRVGSSADDVPWVLYDEDELRAQGVSDLELQMLREGFVPVPYDEAADADERWREIEAYRAASQPSPRHASDEEAEDTGYRGSRWAQGVEHTGMFPVVVPAQRTGGDDL